MEHTNLSMLMLKNLIKMNNIILTEYARYVIYEFIEKIGGLDAISKHKDFYYINICNQDIITVIYESYRHKIIRHPILLSDLTFNEILNDFLYFLDNGGREGYNN